MMLKSDGLLLPHIDKGGFPIKLYKYVMCILYSNTMHTTGQRTDTPVSCRQSDPPPPLQQQQWGYPAYQLPMKRTWDRRDEV